MPQRPEQNTSAGLLFPSSCRHFSCIAVAYLDFNAGFLLKLISSPTSFYRGLSRLRALFLQSLESFVLAVVVADEDSLHAGYRNRRSLTHRCQLPALTKQNLPTFHSIICSECSISQKFYLGRDNKLLGTVQGSLLPCPV